MWLDPLVERRHLKSINVTTNVVNVRMELLKEKRATENKQVGYVFIMYILQTGRNLWNFLLCERRGGLMVIVLDSGSNNRAQALARVTALCSWARYFTVIVPRSLHPGL